MANVGISTLTSTDVHEVTTDKRGTLGQIAMTSDGRKYRYAKNGGTPLVAGAGIKKSATVDASGTTQAAYKPADRMIATGASVSSPAKYEDAIVEINKAKYLANGVTASGVVSLTEPLDVAVAKATAVKISANQFCEVATGTSDTIGTTEVAVPANAYFWALVSM